MPFLLAIVIFVVIFLSSIFQRMNAIFRHGLREANQLVRLTLPGQKFIPHLGIRGIVTELNDSSTPVIGNPSDNKLKKIQFPPFVKDLFLGNFNKSILNYAEVI